MDDVKISPSVKARGFFFIFDCAAVQVLAWKNLYKITFNLLAKFQLTRHSNPLAKFQPNR